MAGHDYIELQGNECILKAVEYLRMLPEWKSKPAKLRTGYVEFAEVLSRHLINLYCKLEGKPLTEKLELDAITNPLQLDLEQKRAAADEATILKSHTERLNSWHLDLSLVETGLSHVVSTIEDDEAMSAIGCILSNRFHDLVESCPFPLKQ